MVLLNIVKQLAKMVVVGHLEEGRVHEPVLGDL